MTVGIWGVYMALTTQLSALLMHLTLTKTLGGREMTLFPF